MNEEIVVKKSKHERIKKVKGVKPEQQKRRSGFNFLDVLIILCILFTVILIVFVYSPSQLFNVRSSDTAIIYSVCISGVPAEYAGTVNVTDIVTDSKGYSLGTVASDVEVEPHVTYVYSENEDGSGKIAEVTHPDLVDLIITVTAKASVDEDGYYVDGKRIAVEAEYDIVLPGFESKGICVSLSEDGASDAGAN